jgi:hypothetical protein
VSGFEKLSEISLAFGGIDRASSAQWAGSPFEWLLSIPSRSKGAFGERFVTELFRHSGFEVKRPMAGSDHDRVVNGHRVEIKLSTLWADTGQYKFQKIRDQAYDFVVCLGLSPQSAHCWVIPKAEIGIGREGVSHQHGGKAGSDTMWLNFLAESPPRWLEPFGGSLEASIKLMRSHGQGPHLGREISPREQVL